MKTEYVLGAFIAILAAALVAVLAYAASLEADIYSLTHTVIECDGVTAKLALGTKEALDFAKDHCTNYSLPANQDYMQ